MSAVQHSLESRDRILEAAHALFRQRGFHQTSVADVAASAHVSVGQIYRLFKGKEDIIHAIAESKRATRDQLMHEQWQRLQAGQSTVEEVFEALFLNVTDRGDEALSFDILAEAFRNSRVKETISSLCTGCRSLLREFACAANPRLSGEDLTAAEELILASMFGLCHRSLTRPELSAESTARGAARMMVAALRGIA